MPKTSESLINRTLYSHDEVINFLTECNKNILRLYERGTFTQSSVILPDNLPLSYKLIDAGNSTTAGKIQLLISIYNIVAKKAEKEEAQYLDEVFLAVKLQHFSTFKPNSVEDGMKAHTATGLAALGNFIKNPTTTTFLKKYNFFSITLDNASAFVLSQAINNYLIPDFHALTKFTTTFPEYTKHITPNTVMQVITSFYELNECRKIFSEFKELTNIDFIAQSIQDVYELEQCLNVFQQEEDKKEAIFKAITKNCGLIKLPVAPDMIKDNELRLKLEFKPAYISFGSDIYYISKDLKKIKWSWEKYMKNYNYDFYDRPNELLEASKIDLIYISLLLDHVAEKSVLAKIVYNEEKFNFIQKLFPDRLPSILANILDNLPFNKLIDFKKLFPSHKELINPALIVKYIKNINRLNQSVQWFPEYKEELIELIFAEPFFESPLIENQDVLKEFSESFPEYSQQEVIKKIILTSADSFIIVFEMFIESFSNHKPTILNIFKENTNLFDKIIKRSEYAFELFCQAFPEWTKNKTLEDVRQYFEHIEEMKTHALVLSEVWQSTNPNCFFRTLPVELAVNIFTKVRNADLLSEEEAKDIAYTHLKV